MDYLLVYAALLALALLIAIDDAAKPIVRYSHGPRIRCPKCRYSLQGLHEDAACPECGFDNAAHAPIPIRISLLASAFTWWGPKSAVLLVIPTSLGLKWMMPALWAALLRNALWVERPLSYGFVGRHIENGTFFSTIALLVIGTVLLTSDARRNVLAMLSLMVAVIIGGTLGTVVTFCNRLLSVHTPGLMTSVGMWAGALLALIGPRWQLHKIARASR